MGNLQEAGHEGCDSVVDLALARACRLVLLLCFPTGSRQRARQGSAFARIEIDAEQFSTTEVAQRDGEHAAPAIDAAVAAELKTG
jgi:hypothetical protein